MTVTVLYYSKYGPASLKLIELINTASLNDDLICIPADNKSTRKLLEQNNIHELPVILQIETNGNTFRYIGKDCFLYFDELLTNKIQEKKKERFTTSTSTLPINKRTFINSSPPSSSFVNENNNDDNNNENYMNTNVKMDRNISSVNFYASEKQNNDIKKNKPPIINNNNDDEVIIDENINEEDFLATPPPTIPSPVSFNNESKNNESKNNKNNKVIEDDDDPSGMGLKIGGGSATSKAQLLENLRTPIKITKTE